MHFTNIKNIFTLYPSVPHPRSGNGSRSPRPDSSLPDWLAAGGPRTATGPQTHSVLHSRTTAPREEFLLLLAHILVLAVALALGWHPGLRTPSLWLPATGSQPLAPSRDTRSSDHHPMSSHHRPRPCGLRTATNGPWSSAPQESRYFVPPPDIENMYIQTPSPSGDKVCHCTNPGHLVSLCLPGSRVTLNTLMCPVCI